MFDHKKAHDDAMRDARSYLRKYAKSSNERDLSQGIAWLHAAYRHRIAIKGVECFPVTEAAEV